MQTFQRLALIAAVAFVPPVSQSAVAAPPGGETTTNVEDLYYDFEVWISEDVTIYLVFVDVDVDDRHPIQIFDFDTEEEAQQFINDVLAANPDIDQIHMTAITVPGPWQYAATHDKRSAAEQHAASVTSYYGFYAKVERVRSLPPWQLRSR